MGIALFIVGLGVLAFPATIEGYGFSTVNCGAPFSRDNAEANDDDELFDSYNKALGRSTSRPFADSAYTKCTNALSLRHGIGWPLMLIGAGGSVYGFLAWNRTRPRRIAAPHTATANEHMQYQPLTAPQHQPQSRARPVSSVGAGWYPDQVDPTRVRWFDGEEWTEATLARTDGSPNI
ncbi:DUF2510 domain-containing protein [Rhodococcus sp. ARC_M6]|uniref:DUF2510 domain-containing protein n=1 Tax=Rhodococcus sp. ARC_M6 TaxID=2928852 RepID=UPI001FB53016|nr:DUF2510 domain-containing protein [Rhodococcus sp. ARC_M6]MCJ0907094.1 DUF2510 domain-containing protein [Rhodococcus sp. ARC_M6]